MASKGKSARTKGHVFERDIVSILRDLGYEAMTSRYESKRLDDLGSDIVTDFPFHIQAKAVERMSMPCHDLLKKMKEVLKDKPSCVFHKRNNKGTTVTLDLDIFIALIHEK